MNNIIDPTYPSKSRLSALEVWNFQVPTYPGISPRPVPAFSRTQCQACRMPYYLLRIIKL